MFLVNFVIIWIIFFLDNLMFFLMLLYIYCDLFLVWIINDLLLILSGLVIGKKLLGLEVRVVFYEGRFIRLSLI